MTTKIDIISGFLGAGKTTFIKKLLEEAIVGEQVVLIENEFGKVGIDSGFLKHSGIEIREMNSGCICCSLVGDFGESLKEVLTKYQPQRVLIEPSGVGKLSDVIKAVRDVASNLDVILNSAVTIVDASKCNMYMKNFGEFFNNQIEYAKTIVLTRTDVADVKKVQQAVDLIRVRNQEAAIVTTPLSQLSGEQLLEMIEKQENMEKQLLEEVRIHHSHGTEGCKGRHHEDGEEGCGCHHHEDGEEGCKSRHREGGEENCKGRHQDGEEGNCGCHHQELEHTHEEDCSCGCKGHHDHDHNHHADEVFTSWGLETILPITREKLEKILDELAYGSLYGDVLRAKGMLPGEIDGEWLYFDLVPEEFEIRTGSPDYTGKVCVIGADLKEDQLNHIFGRS